MFWRHLPDVSVIFTKKLNYFIAQKISVSIAASLIQVMPFSLLMTPLLIVFLAIGILVGAFGGAMAIRNYLKV